MSTNLDYLHPAHFIREEMAARGWDLDYLAAKMLPPEVMADKEASIREYGITRLALELYIEVRDTDVILCDKQSGELGRAFGTDPGFFKRLHDSWRAKALAAERGAL